MEQLDEVQCRCDFDSGEVRQLTEAGCEIYPMKWVGAHKNAHPRRDNDYVSVPAKYKGRLVGCGNLETTQGLRTDSPAGDVDSHKIDCSWRAQARLQSLLRFHELIHPRTRNRSHLAVSYSS